MMPVSSATPQEVARQHQSAYRVIPAEEGFHPDARVRLQIELGLEEHTQLVVIEGASQGSLGEQPRDRLRVHGLVEQLVAGPTATLGAVHRGVGVLQQARRPFGRAVGDGDPDARRHRDLGPRQHERFDERGRGTLGQLDRLFLAVQVLAEHDELVATEPRHRVLEAHGVAEPAAHRDQELVAGLVAEAVVHVLEPVEVDEQHRHHRFVVSVGETSQRVPEPVLCERTVRHVRERVVEREVPELLRARVAVDRDGDEVADAFEHGELAGLRVAHGGEEEPSNPRNSLPSGLRIGTDHTHRRPYERQRSLTSGREPSVARSRTTCSSVSLEEGFDVLDGGERADGGHVLGIEARCGDRVEGAAVRIEQPDAARAVGHVLLERFHEHGQRLGDRCTGEDELEARASRSRRTRRRACGR